MVAQLSLHLSILHLQKVCMQIGRAAIRMDGVEMLRSNYYDYEKNYWNSVVSAAGGAEADDPKHPLPAGSLKTR